MHGQNQILTGVSFISRIAFCFITVVIHEPLRTRQGLYILFLPIPSASITSRLTTRRAPAIDIPPCRTPWLPLAELINARPARSLRRMPYRISSKAWRSLVRVQSFHRSFKPAELRECLSVLACWPTKSGVRWSASPPSLSCR